MTYRKLFLLLVLTATLVMAGLWWRSREMYHYSGVRLHPLSETDLKLFLLPGTVKLELSPAIPWPDRISYTQIPYEALPPSLHPDNYPVPGRFRAYRASGEARGYSGGIVLGLELPLWVPWLAFASVAFMACRWLEKRAGAVRERMLAESGGS